MEEMDDPEFGDRVNQLLPDLSRYYVVAYQHIDDFRCMRPLPEYFDVFPADKRRSKFMNDILFSEIEQNLTDFFMDNGWEGDGTIECIFIPPCFYSDSDTCCESIFHVKQDKNGTSFLAIPKHLKLELPTDY